MLFFYSASRVLYTRITFTFSRRFLGLHRKRMSTSVDLGDMRVKYCDKSEAFTEDQLVSTTDPIAQFTAWFEEVKKCKDIIEPNAMCVATANKNGFPSARMVLLKGYGPDGFKFFTNYESRKGCELDENPQASILFYWPPFNRQVRIEGKVKKLDASEAEQYFNRRPLGSRVSAAVSRQSQPVPSREHLIVAANELMDSGDVKRPSFWGGYIIRHDVIEFWQGQSDRLHDRIVFERSDDDNWTLKRLQP